MRLSRSTRRCMTSRHSALGDATEQKVTNKRRQDQKQKQRAAPKKTPRRASCKQVQNKGGARGCGYPARPFGYVFLAFFLHKGCVECVSADRLFSKVYDRLFIVTTSF
jgi:hypothetical protein